MPLKPRLDFLVVGHVTRDIEDGGWRPGGAAVYASVAAARLGLNAQMLTALPAGADLRDIPQSIKVHRLPSPTATDFINTYLGSSRTQRVTSIAAPIGPADVPDELTAAPVVLLGPVIGEVDPAVRSRFSGNVGIGAQGWLRAAVGDRVVFTDWQADAALEGSAAVFVSTEDAPADRLPTLVQHWTARAPIVIVTAGPRGGTAYISGEERTIPTFPARQVDPTGAGDVFAAGFLARYAETSDPYEALEFAAAAAACSVEGVGISAIPDREMISARRREGASG